MSEALFIGGPLNGIQRDQAGDPDTVDMAVSNKGKIITGPVDTKKVGKVRTYVYARVTFQLPDAFFAFYVPADVPEAERVGYVIWNLSANYQLQHSEKTKGAKQ